MLPALVAVIPGKSKDIRNAFFPESVQNSLPAVYSHRPVALIHPQVSSPPRMALPHQAAHGTSGPIVVLGYRDPLLKILGQNHYGNRAVLQKPHMLRRDGNGAEKNPIYVLKHKPLDIFELPLYAVIRVLDQRLIPLLPQIASHAGDHPAGNFGV